MKCFIGRSGSRGGKEKAFIAETEESDAKGYLLVFLLCDLGVLSVEKGFELRIPFQVGDIHIGSGDLFLIAGPCVIESEEHAMRMAEIIKGVARSLEFPLIFKASYDKANRTSIRSFRGPGVERRLAHSPEK